MSEVKISTITLQIGEKSITLSIEDAKKCRDALNDIFGKPEMQIKVIEREIIRDNLFRPYITWEDTSDKFRSPDIIYCASDNALQCKL